MVLTDPGSRTDYRLSGGVRECDFSRLIGLMDEMQLETRPASDCGASKGKGSLMRWACLVMLLMSAGTRASGAVALFLGEPFGEAGAGHPTGQAAVYLHHSCAA